MADDWDLFAVVRSCCSSAATSSSSSSSSTFLSLENNSLSIPPDPFETKKKTETEDLQDLYKPFLFNKSNPLLPISPLSVLGGLHDVSPPQRAAQPPPPPLPVKRHSVLACVTPSPKSKRRKIQKKLVCQVAAEDLSSDTWSWRKYGQKPIKGSPYPRGYYKCSTSKGCLARKQVERNRSDPGMFIVTYTAEHNHPMPTHRSSLSGISRLKPDNPNTVTTTEKREKEEREDFPEPDEEEDEFDGSDMVVGDDFFEGLEDFTGEGDSLTGGE